ncbi:MAG: twin-arginine translocase subunit TatC, partial [Alphaproteobacteria bacterium]
MAENQDTAKLEQEGEGGQMSLIGHLTELRNRLGIALVAFLVLFILFISPMPGGGVNNSIANHVFIFLQAPLAEIMMEKGGGRMIFTALHEGFFTQIKVGLFAALCVSFPIISMQLYKFVAPALYKNEKELIQKYLKKYQPNGKGSPVSYKTARHGWGRPFPLRSLGFSGFRRQVRHTIAGKYYDIDIANCQPQILYW